MANDQSDRVMDMTPDQKRQLLAQLLERKAKEGQVEFPLSIGQQALWFQHQMAPESAAYNICFCSRLVSPIDEAVLRNAIDKLVDRHPMLRASYPSRDGVPAMRIHAKRNYSFRHHSDGGLNDESLYRKIYECYCEPFDIENGPIFRIDLYRVTDTERILLLTIHHIACDGWSIGLLIRDLRTFCQYEVDRDGHNMPPVSGHYVDFIKEQHGMITGAEGQRLREFWAHRLAGELPVLDLPLVRPRPKTRKFEGATHAFTVDDSIYQKIKTIAQAEKVTLYAILLSAFQVLLMRYSGQEDVLVGTPVAGRDRVAHMQVIGLFINQIVMRGDLSGNPTFREFLQKNRLAINDALEHQAYPFPLLVQQLKQSRDPSCHPVFQVLFNLIKQSSLGSIDSLLDGTAHKTPMDFGPFKLKPYPIPQQEGQFDLSLEMVYGDLKLLSSFRYRTDVFDKDTIERMGVRFRRLLESIVTDPEQRLWELPARNNAHWYSSAPLPDPTAELSSSGEESILDRVASIGRSFPERIAVVDGNGAWTYKEICDNSDRVAWLLASKGIQPEGIVAVHAKRSAVLVVVLLGIWKAGGAFLILDSSYPPQHLISIAAKVGPLGYIRIGEANSQKEVDFQEKVPFDCLLQIPLKKQEAALRLSTNQPTLRLPEQSQDSIAYIAFTSGTTGSAKYIAGTQRPIAHFLGWYCKEFEITNEDRFSMLSGLGHDPLMRDIFAPLWVGGTLAVPDPAILTSPHQLRGWMQRSRISVSHMTPAMGALLTMGHEDQLHGEVFELSDLRRIFFGGDILTLSHLQAISRVAPHAQLVNFYGATETPQAMACFRIPRLTVDAPCNPLDTIIPIGVGIPDVQLLVLSSHGTLADVDEIGEICIRTHYLTNGYLQDEKLTLERFVVNPFTGLPEDRIYRSGDLGRYRSDGSVIFCGRKDRQLKVRGFRIDPEVIENELKAHPSVIDAHVMMKDPNSHLVAYVVNASGATIDSEELRRHISGHLPMYMVPSEFVAIDTMPLTPNGKIDRQALMRLCPPHSLGEPQSGARLPESFHERLVYEIWREVLGLSRIDLHDNFFQLGGHSLIAAQIVSRIHKRLNLEIPIQTIFEAPTIVELAHRIESLSAPASRTGRMSLQAVSRSGLLALSFAQERLWFLSQLEPESTAYSMPISIRLRGGLDHVALQSAFNEIVGRHESLRTTFRAVDGQPEQVVAADAGVVFEEMDLSHLPEGEGEDEVRHLADLESRKPFDLQEGPLFRVILYRIGERDHVLNVNMHHIISDYWSLEVFSREFVASYAAAVEGVTAQLPELSIQYVDFAHCQRQWLQGEVLDAHLHYWREKLGGELATLDLPTDRPRPAMQTHRGAVRSLEIPAGLLDELRSLSQREGASLFMVLLAAFKLLLHRYSGQTDIIVGTPVAGRDRVELEQLIGFFINTIVMRTDVSGAPTFRELLARVRETAFGAYAHQAMPFEKLVEDLAPTRDLSRTPIFQVFFNHIRMDSRPFILPGLEAEVIASEERESKFDMTLYVWEHAEGLRLKVLYNVDLFDGERMTLMLEQLLHLFEQIVEAPDRKIGAFTLVGPAHREWLPDPSVPLTAVWTDCVQQRFAQIARIGPQQPALVDPWGEWSYKALESCSNRLANYLRVNGLTAGDTVAVYSHRSAGLVLALLGVLKAGGVFLILDPSYPAERLTAVLEAAGPAGWLQLEAAGPLSEDLELFLAKSGIRIRLKLPRTAAEVSGLLGELPEAAPKVTILPQHRAYVVFTSGSTGTPKGIVGLHGPLSHFIDWHCRESGFGAPERFSMLSGLAHDPLLRDIFTPLWAGATLCIPSPELMLMPEDLRQWMREQGITTAHLTPAMSQVLTEGVEGGPESEQLPALRRVFFGGDILTGVHVAKLRKAAPGVACINFYGTTETPQAMGCHWVEGNCFEGASVAGAIPLGRGIEGVQLLVLNGLGHLAGVGEVGEIHVRTPYLAEGYLNDTQLTGERFIPNPHSGEAGDRLYKTGDLGRYRSDGAVVFCGRADRQVSIRGFRIELKEVEAVISGHSDVEDCAVVVSRREGGENFMAAFVVMGEGKKFDRQGLMTYLRRYLPLFMMPTDVAALDSLPLTPNGKVDYKALSKRTVAFIEHRVKASHVPPTTPMQKKIAAIWSEVLGVAQVGVHDNFFDLGGNSLLTVQILWRMKRELGRTIELRWLFSDPTVAAIAEFLEKEHFQAGASESLFPIQRNGRKRPLFVVAGAHENDEAFMRYLSNLVPYLGSEQPVYGLRPRGAIRLDRKIMTVEKIAGIYLQEIRKIQPSGPYLILGECVGGVIAYELACQLAEAGMQIARLIIMDTPCPRKYSVVLYRARYAIQKIRNRLKVIARLLVLDTGAFRKVRTKVVAAFPSNRDGSRVGGTESTAGYDYRLIVFKYRPREYHQGLTFIYNQESFEKNPTVRWKDYVHGGYELIIVPGNHQTRLTRFGKITAQRIVERLDHVGAVHVSENGLNSRSTHEESVSAEGAI